LLRQSEEKQLRIIKLAEKVTCERAEHESERCSFSALEYAVVGRHGAARVPNAGVPPTAVAAGVERQRGIAQAPLTSKATAQLTPWHLIFTSAGSDSESKK
jgi:hypothetical protein